ncbi:unnamed protein product [Ixodes persulcatus]
MMRNLNQDTVTQAPVKLNQDRLSKRSHRRHKRQAPLIFLNTMGHNNFAQGPLGHIQQLLHSSLFGNPQGLVEHLRKSMTAGNESAPSELHHPIGHPFMIFMHRVKPRRNFQPSVVVIEPPRNKTTDHQPSTENRLSVVIKKEAEHRSLRKDGLQKGGLQKDGPQKGGAREDGFQNNGLQKVSLHKDDLQKDKSTLQLLFPGSQQLGQLEFQKTENRFLVPCDSKIDSKQNLVDIFLHRRPLDADAKDSTLRAPNLEVSFDHQVLEFDDDGLTAASSVGYGTYSVIVVASITAIITVLLLLAIGTVSYLLVDCLDAEQTVSKCRRPTTSILVGNLDYYLSNRRCLTNSAVCAPQSYI